MSLFHHQSIHFTAKDPLANGLADEIAKEQSEPEAITTLDDMQADDLEAFWGKVVSDAKNDKDFFAYAED